MDNITTQRQEEEDPSDHRFTNSPSTPITSQSISSTSSLPAQWKSSAIPLNRREQVHRYVGHIPSYTPKSTSANRRYELVIREQPQQCRMSGFGEKDRRPIDPAPIVQLIIYEDDQPIDLKEQQYPLCILHVSLWSEDQSQQLDTVQIISRKTTSTQQQQQQQQQQQSSSSSFSSIPLISSSSTPNVTNPVRTMIGTLSSSPCVLRDQQHQLGLYFSFPDIGVRVAKTYCLKFDLVVLEESSQMGESVAHVYSDPFIAYSVKGFPGMKESSDLAKHLSRQGLKVSVRHSVRPKKRKDGNSNKEDDD